jgi:hypothetical protein
MKRLLTLTAVIESGTGLALLAAPVVVVQLLLGAEITGPAVPLGRVAGTALLALGVACWIARGDVGDRAARGLVAAIWLYDVGAVVVLGSAGIQSQTAGVQLWLVVVFHAAMAIWCATLLSRKPDDSGQP